MSVTYKHRPFRDTENSRRLGHFLDILKEGTEEEQNGKPRPQKLP